MFYLLFLFVYTCGIHYLASKSTKSALWIWCVSLLPLFLYGALRVDCGDYSIYQDYNSWVRGSHDIYSVIERMEPGYAYLNMILPYRSLIIITSLLSCFSYAFFISKLVPRRYWWFALVLVFFACDKTIYFIFSSIRNSIAMDILLIVAAVTMVEKKTISHKVVLIVITALLSSTFHLSALIFFPLTFLFLRTRQMSKTEGLVWLVVLFILLFTPVESMIDRIPFFQIDIFERYDEYVEESHDAGLMAKLGASIFACLLIFNNLKRDQGEVVNALSRVALLFVYSFLLGSLNMRVSQYYVLFAIAYLACVFPQRKKSIITFLLLCYAAAFILYSTFIAGAFASDIYSPLVIYKISFSL